MKIVAVCGSLRKASVNRALLRALADVAPAGVTVDIRDLHGIPVYDGDLEADGMPAAVTALQDAIASSDVLLLASPEYNGGVPGPLKNAMDWCTRGGRMREVFAGRKTALCGATPGLSGTRLAQQAWLQTFRQLGVEAYTGQLYVHGAFQVFTDGELTDEPSRERFRAFMTGLVEFAS